MKNIHKFLIFFLTIAVFGIGCKKQLDKKPLNQVTSETYWKTDNDAVMFATQAYNFLPNQESAYYEAFSDNGYTKDNAQRVFGNGTYTALNTGRDFDYTSIRHCLIFLRDVEKVPNMNVALKARLIGEVKFILAFRYFLLTTLYRDVPLVEQVYADGSKADIPKTAKAAIIAKIEQWLNEAANVLPVTYSNAGDKGRVTKGAAYALLARLYLYNNKFAEAADNAKKVMDLGVYNLYPDYYKLFQEEGDYSQEDILSYGYVGLAGTPYSNSMRNLLGSLLQLGNNRINPTSELAADYETDQGYYPYTTDPRYSPAAPFDNRDPRMRQTLYYPGAFEANPAFPPKNQFDPINDPGDGIGRDQGTSTGFSWTKNVQSSDWSKGQNNGNNWKIIRYAEVLLTFAEAMNETSGTTPEVIKAIDDIRTRANMPTVATTFALRGMAINKDNMRTFIRHERRIELAGEGLRYFDILRWKIGEQVLNGPIYTVDASAGIAAISTAGGKKNTYPKTTIETRIFTSKNYVWPIPQSAIDRSKGILIQHDEWK
jgi:hypothetical protein